MTSFGRKEITTKSTNIKAVIFLMSMPKLYLILHPSYISEWIQIRCAPPQTTKAIMTMLLFPSCLSVESIWAWISKRILHYHSFVYSTKQWWYGKTVTVKFSFSFLCIHLAVVMYFNAGGIGWPVQNSHSKRKKQMINKSTSKDSQLLQKVGDNHHK